MVLITTLLLESSLVRFSTVFCSRIRFVTIMNFLADILDQKMSFVKEIFLFLALSLQLATCHSRRRQGE